MSHQSAFKQQCPQNTMSERSSSSKSPSASSTLSEYKKALTQFKEFFSTFENKLQSVYEKENYRIYLNDKFHQKIFKQLVKQEQSLHQALQESKDYKQSANRALIQEVMNLEKLKQQYEAKNYDYLQKIVQKKQQLTDKKQALKILEAEIKSYWIYNYDITSTSLSSLSTISRINHPKINLKSSRNQTQGNINQQGNDPTKTLPDDKENNISIANLQKPKYDTTPTPVHKVNSIHLPTIPHHTRNATVLRCASNYSNYTKSFADQKTTTILSKDLSMINSSMTREKLFQKIESSNMREAVMKLEYQRQKLNLLKFFKIYLKKTSQEQANFTERMRMEKVVSEIEECINEKDKKLKQIEELLAME